MALNKAGEIVLYACATTSTDAVAVGAALDVSTYYDAEVRIRMGRPSGTAFTVAPRIRLEGAFATSPTANQWCVLATFSPALGASIGATTFSGSAGDATISLSSATNFASGDFIHIQSGAASNFEWKHTAGLSGTTLTLQDTLVNLQSLAVVRNQSEEWAQAVDLTGIKNLRIVVSAIGSVASVTIEAGLAAVSAL